MNDVTAPRLAVVNAAIKILVEYADDPDGSPALAELLIDRATLRFNSDPIAAIKDVLAAADMHQLVGYDAQAQYAWNLADELLVDLRQMAANGDTDACAAIPAAEQLILAAESPDRDAAPLSLLAA